VVDLGSCLLILEVTLRCQDKSWWDSVDGLYVSFLGVLRVAIIVFLVLITLFVLVALFDRSDDVLFLLGGSLFLLDLMEID
jgi:hypothetical protein